LLISNSESFQGVLAASASSGTLYTVPAGNIATLTLAAISGSSHFAGSVSGVAVPAAEIAFTIALGNTSAQLAISKTNGSSAGPYAITLQNTSGGATIVTPNVAGDGLVFNFNPAAFTTFAQIVTEINNWYAANHPEVQQPVAVASGPADNIGDIAPVTVALAFTSAGVAPSPTTEVLVNGIAALPSSTASFNVAAGDAISVQAPAGGSVTYLLSVNEFTS